MCTISFLKASLLETFYIFWVLSLVMVCVLLRGVDQCGEVFTFFPFLFVFFLSCVHP